MQVSGYLIDVTLADDTLTVHGRNKAARIALAGEDHERDVVVPIADIAELKMRTAGRMVNGSLVVTTTTGRKYQLHFRHKHNADFAALDAAIRAGMSSTEPNPAP